MKRIVVTGGIGAGKSAVCAEFVRLGAPTISADEIARLVVAPKEAGWNGIRELFGDAVFEADGSLDRKKLASIVFGDARARVQLEQILHPLIRSRIEQEIVNLGSVDAVAVEIPLFSRAEAAISADVVVVVTAPWHVREARLVAERGYSPQEVAARSEAQVEDEARLELADFVIANSGSREHLAREVRKVFDAIQAKPGANGTNEY